MKKFSHKPYLNDTETIVFQVPPPEIGYINSLTEAYEGMAIMRTLDENRGIVEFWVIAELRPAFDDFLNALNEEIPLRRIQQDNA